MNIEKQLINKEYTIRLTGRLDTNTAPELEVCIKEVFNEIDSLIFDFQNLEYISSAGLRVLLASYKKMHERNGKFAVINYNDTIKEIFEITGLYNIFNL